MFNFSKYYDIIKLKEFCILYLIYPSLKHNNGSLEIRREQNVGFVMCKAYCFENLIFMAYKLHLFAIFQLSLICMISLCYFSNNLLAAPN